MDSHFSRFLVDQASTGDAALTEWGGHVMGSAREAYSEVAEGLGGDGAALRVEVEGRRRLEAGLSRAEREHPFRGDRWEEAS